MSGERAANEKKRKNTSNYNMADWLITLLAQYYSYKLLSLFYFILLSKGLSAAPGKN